MSKQVQFKVSIIAATISMMMAGSAFAAGNVVVGPAVTSGVAHVNINQVGTDNVLSKDATATTTNNAFVVNTGTGTLDLTIQQVGATGTPSGNNKIALNANTSTANADAKIRVFQGGDAAGPGGTTGVGTDIGGGASGADNLAVTNNQATISLSNGGASEILVSQQGNSNVAALTLGSTAFKGVMQVVQLGDSNNAGVTVSNQAASQTFNIGQSGAGNTVTLSAVSVGGPVTANFGEVDFTKLATTSKPTATDSIGHNDATTKWYSTGNGVTASAEGGIKLGSINSFNLLALGGYNQVQADLSTADIGAKVNVTLNGNGVDTGANLALNVANSAQFNLGGTSGVTVNDGNTLAMYDNGAQASQSVNGVTFNGNGYFSTSASATATGITLTNGFVDAGGASVLQSKEGSSFSAVGTAATHWVLDVNQGGTSVGTVAITSANGGLFDLTQTSGATDSGHSMTLADTTTTTAGSWTVVQEGAGAKILGMTSSTDSAVINVSQTGAVAQSATAITFAAASGSTFYLAQK